MGWDAFDYHVLVVCVCLAREYWHQPSFKMKHAMSSGTLVKIRTFKESRSLWSGWEPTWLLAEHQRRGFDIREEIRTLTPVQKAALKSFILISVHQATHPTRPMPVIANDTVAGVDGMSDERIQNNDLPRRWGPKTLPHSF